MWQKITTAAFAAAICEAFVGFSLGFAPGWANGWPFGWTIYVIWSGGMALLTFLMFVSMGAGLGAMVGWACSRRGLGSRYGLATYVAWLVVVAAAALVVSVHVYDHFHAAAWEMWPNGYPSRP